MIRLARRLLTSGAPTPFRIGINGAGPAGLCVAGILSHSKQPDGSPTFLIDVFERDERERDQGAGWDISSDAKKTFERAGLDWRTICREGSATWRIYRVGEHEQPIAMVSLPEVVKRLTGTGQPESNRHAMREGLLAAMGAGTTVHFDKAIVGLERGEGATATLLAEGGSRHGPFDLVVDASGVASPLRKLCVDEEGTAQHYNGLTMVNGIVGDPEGELDPQLVRMLGEGTVEFVGDRPDGAPDGPGGFDVILQRYGNEPSDRRAKMQSWFMRERRGQLGEELALGRVPFSKISRHEHPEAHARVLQLVKDHMGDRWPRMYHELVDALEPVQVWDLHQFPSDAALRGDRTLPLVLVGDALHAMSPTSGSGGNLACKDADDLATYILETRPKGSAALVDGLVPLMQGLLTRMEPNQRKGEWNADRFRNVLRNTRPVLEYYNRWTPFEGAERVFGSLAWLILRPMQWVHQLEGFGLPPRQNTES